MPHLTVLLKRVAPNQGKLLPHAEGEPNFYEIEKQFPLPPHHMVPYMQGYHHPYPPAMGNGYHHYAGGIPPSEVPAARPYPYYPGAYPPQPPYYGQIGDPNAAAAVNQMSGFSPYPTFYSAQYPYPSQYEQYAHSHSSPGHPQGAPVRRDNVVVKSELSKGKPKCPNNTIAATNVASSGCADALAIHKKRRDKKNKRRITSSTNSNTTMMNESISHQSREEERTTIVSGQLQQEQREADDICINESTSSTQTLTVNHHSRKEFFLRARVVADDEEIISQKTSSSSSSSSAASSVVGSQWNRRILVRYSRGATYRVHAYNLIPVLEPSVHHNAVSSFSEVPTKTAATPSTTTTKCTYNYPPLVVLVPETNIYRRVAKVHTTPNDTFMEIGCDYGITVDKIRHSLEEAGNVPRVWAEKNVGGEIIGEDTNNCIAGTTLSEEMDDVKHQISCLGVDKSVESINIANERCDTK